MRSWTLAVLTVAWAACGRGGDPGGLGTNNEGIQNNTVAPNGCVAPGAQGWTDPHDALDHGGATGDLCSFTGGGGNGSQIDFCMAHTLFIINETSADSSFCIADGGGVPPAVKLPGDCAEACFTSGGAFIDCLAGPVHGPNRPLAGAWSLNAESDCDALMSGCPQVGDPCSGNIVCGGFWHPDQPSTSLSFEGRDAEMWCDGGKLKVVIHL